MIFLVHHADALQPAVEASRPLSDRGRAQAQLLAFQAARLGAKPDCIWHSGKLRARQTAEFYWRECNPFAVLTAERGLLPDDPPAWMRDRFFGDPRELMAVGHMPHLLRLLRLMLGEEPDRSHVSFPLNGMVALGVDGGRWRESWRLAP